jgi:hypothetical protein
VSSLLRERIGRKAQGRERHPRRIDNDRALAVAPHAAYGPNGAATSEAHELSPSMPSDMRPFFAQGLHDNPT